MPKVPKVKRKITFIVLHYTASKDVSAATINIWHKQRGFREIGYHYVIRENGTVEVGRNLNKIGAHTRGKNVNSVGIVLTGHNSLAWYPSNKQIVAARHLVSAIQDTYNIRDSEIYLHRELGNTSCPGRLTKEQILAKPKKKKKRKKTEQERADEVYRRYYKGKIDNTKHTKKESSVISYRQMSERKKLWLRLFPRK